MVIMNSDHTNLFPSVWITVWRNSYESGIKNYCAGVRLSSLSCASVPICNCSIRYDTIRYDTIGIVNDVTESE